MNMKTVLNTCFNKYIVNFWIDEEGNETTMNKTIQSPYLTDTEKKGAISIFTFHYWCLSTGFSHISNAGGQQVIFCQALVFILCACELTNPLHTIYCLRKM